MTLSYDHACWIVHCDRQGLCRRVGEKLLIREKESTSGEEVDQQTTPGRGALSGLKLQSRRDCDRLAASRLSYIYIARGSPQCATTNSIHPNGRRQGPQSTVLTNLERRGV